MGGMTPRMTHDPTHDTRMMEQLPGDGGSGAVATLVDDGGGSRRLQAQEGRGKESLPKLRPGRNRRLEHSIRLEQEGVPWR